MAAIYCESFTVRHREADRVGRLRIASWFDFLQESAANHASLLGVGLEALTAADMMWVLSRIRLDIRRYPEIGETVRVETWPNGFRKVFAARQFRIVDSNGYEIARASSLWLLLSASRLRPLKMDRLPVALPEPGENQPDYFDLADKLPGPAPSMTEMAVPVRYSMEDVNGHMNNAEYAGLVQDYAAQNGLATHFRTLEIHFHAAAQTGDLLKVSGALAPEGLTVGGAIVSTGLSGSTIVPAALPGEAIASERTCFTARALPANPFLSRNQNV